ncbi:cytochrome c oxidase subunit 3 [Methylocystis sp. B8]|uniref:cytochrome c oxidase subunit 3 n=1 Tax=Methylocystis sp. B8 TaxID=544938 RepID=UPI0010FDED38|nr:cytochrome c oxidase subunit 3 [Methylocystis sp. B8]TLG73695.1 cytochrome c oxidase subunit 3 [Methylocystis sp. B8]
MSDVATHEFQFASAEHQRETAISGIWLFLASEALFFGPIFLSWIYARLADPSAFDAGARQTDLTIGIVNTALLIASSFAYGVGLASIQFGSRRRMVVWLLFACTLGLAFLGLKFGVEWRSDLEKGLFPGANFSIQGPTRNGAQLFFAFYFFSTALHGLHLIVGLGLVAWIISQARQFTPKRHTPVLIVGLYWTFIDIIWLVLFPLIYLIGRAS